MKNHNYLSLTLALTIIITVYSTSAQSQQSQPRDSVVFKLTIAKASDNDFTKGKPAEFIGTFPSSDTVSNSWLTNALIETSLGTAISRWSFGLTAELHRNTLIEKKQDVRQLGISMGKVIVLQRQSIGSSSFEMPLTLNFKNSEDKIKDKEELQAILGLSFDRLVGVQILRTKSLFPAYGKRLAQVLMFSHDHNFGLAYLGDGKAVLGQFDFEFNLFFLPILSDLLVDRYDLFKAQFTYNGRSEFINEVDRDLDTQFNFQVGINLPFGSDNQNSLGIAHDWIKGADPLKGLDDQQYRTLTVKAKIIIK
ncbi:hypothetical protein SanaruYs_37490 [Chryseotalea sanaruensis]|uniref:Secreted protein n=1 Tax=Chryseotalea sanaruensis TaxID=2482724 RepID=A0A401UF76_9BACT|nr:hypothetical protein [Chryseotalea sanaruensis]GCC53504.1 hypothetical protein SanaruYs_37490 [Chryseotalea sanaruensis]